MTQRVPEAPHMDIIAAGQGQGWYRPSMPATSSQDLERFEHGLNRDVIDALSLPGRPDYGPGSETRVASRPSRRAKFIGTIAAASVLAFPNQTAEVVDVVKDKAVQTVTDAYDRVHDRYFGPDDQGAEHPTEPTART